MLWPWPRRDKKLAPRLRQDTFFLLLLSPVQKTGFGLNNVRHKKIMNSRFFTIALIASVAAGAEVKKTDSIPKFETDYISIRTLIASRAKQSKGDSVQRWHELGRPKGVVLVKAESSDSIAYVFLPGTNWGVFSARLVRRAEVFSSLPGALQFVRAKPRDVCLTIVENGFRDGADISLTFPGKDVTVKFSRAEMEAFDAALPKEPNQPADRMPGSNAPGESNRH